MNAVSISIAVRIAARALACRSLILLSTLVAVAACKSESSFSGSAGKKTATPQTNDAVDRVPDDEEEPSEPSQPTPPPSDEEREFGDRLNEQGAKSGAIQVSLLWNNVNDLDLYVSGPTNEIISFLQRNDSAGGFLDVDMNVGGVDTPMSQTPVENVYWSEFLARRGTYRVWVQNYQARIPEAATAFTVRVKVGTDVKHFQGQAPAPFGDNTPVANTVPANSVLVHEFVYNPQ